MRDHLLLFINGKSVTVTGEDAFLTLSEFLRRRQRLTGTKIVCAEGDCGSCSVLLGRVDGQQIRYSAVTSCIQMMFQLDGMHVITIEGLGRSGELNPIQEAMVSCQGTQCGFCTPGFVVAMYDLMRDGLPRDGETVRRGLVGNLCRCTGYDSILRAAMQTDLSGIKSLDQLYPPDAMLPALSPAAATPVLIRAGDRVFHKPVTIESATQFRAEHPTCTVISGATDIGVVVNKRLRELHAVLGMGGIAGLRAVRREDDALYIGAATPLSELESAANQHIPELGRYLAQFGSPLIKNAGTIAGNIVTGSPIGDTIPPLLVLDAEVDVAGVNSKRRIALRDFYAGYRKTRLAADELVTGVRIPYPPSDSVFRLYKVSRRLDLDISVFNAAIVLQLSGERIDDIRIAFGGVGPMVLRMNKTEAALRGQIASRELFERAAAIAKDEVTPIGDVRGSADYRRTLAGNILLKFWHEATVEA